MASIALHLSPFLVTLLLPDLLWGTRQPAPPSYMEVVMVTREVTPPEPEPEPEPEEEPEPTPPPTPPPEDVLGLRASPTPTPPPTPTPTPPPKPTQTPQATPAPAPDEGETSDQVFASSQEKGIFDRVQGLWLLPPGITANLNCEVQVTVNARGDVMGAKVTRSSGSAIFDDSIVRAIYKSSPLPINREDAPESQTLVMEWTARDLM